MSIDADNCVALSGGVGGTKLILGLSHVINGNNLSVIGNTGDDFEHLGLAISPDLDTLLYTLAGQVNPETGWGRSNETWSFMEALDELGGETWFRLGDRDLAVHLERTRRLTNGDSLSEVTTRLCNQLGITMQILPMTDETVRTRVLTDRGALDFQHYFVRDRAEPRVLGLEYVGAESARPTKAVLEALNNPDLAAIIIAPSNPYLSIDPILAIPGIRSAIAAASAPVVAVSPIVAGAAIKGPTAKIMAEFGHDTTAAGIASHYHDLLDGFILDEMDQGLAAEVKMLNLEVGICDTVMKSLNDKIRLARFTLEFAASIGKRTA